MRPNEVDLALHLLDDQLIDAEGKRRGRVDDVELTGGAGKPTQVSALLVGAATWPARLRPPFDAALRPFVPRSMHRVDWSAVDDVTTSVKLSARAAELGLGTDDGRNVRWVGAPDSGCLRLSSLLGKPLVTRTGRDLGRVRDVRAERIGAGRERLARERWVITGLLVGKAAILQRLGVTKGERLERQSDSELPPNFVPWRRLVEVGTDELKAYDD